MSAVIKLDHLSKDYGNGRGIFDECLEINKGDMLGFVGTNGSGKTTTIRSIMGFIRPSNGCSYVNGLESYKNASVIAKSIGYVPGEIAFPDLGSGNAFLKSQAEFLGLKDMSYANELVNILQLDPRAGLKRMSKGMKQKTAIVAALMANPPIIILDEPTTGLDPLMREAFVEVIKKEHEKGKTILMSSHMFEEVEDTCDHVALISDGHIIDCVKMDDIINRPSQEFKIEFNKADDYERFKKSGFKIIRDQSQYQQLTIALPRNDSSSLFKALSAYDVRFISEVKYTLDKHFQEVLEEKKNVQ
ncbi:MAG: ABC transporter ATP-binding protein [Bacilli bacterium]|jgi:ABC-2 type transport system ATP-binding protein|nr:ABC transporter ATP-binding protein [Bacilli bacterium]MCI2055377.1 ABC transporter ATP-binding protein [Bacilli bacterium]